MANGLLYVPRDQDWTLLATLSATSEQVGYEATRAATDDPSEPWWADSTTATLTVTLGATRSIDCIALIMTNADDAKVITIGGLSGGSRTLVGTREASGYPRDLVLLLDSPETASAITIAVSGNTNSFSIGRVVVGLTEQLPENLLLGVTVTPFRQQYSDEYPDFRHDIRYDIGAEGWVIEGDIIHPNRAVNESPEQSAQAQFDAWWFGTKGGFLATLIVPHPDLYPPFWVRMTMAMPRSHSDAPEITRSHLTFTPLSRGREVVG
jgi:hypothetical protein